MIQIRTVKLSHFIRLLFFVILIMTSLFFARTIFLQKNVQISSIIDSKTFVQDNIYELIMKKTMPIMNACMGSDANSGIFKLLPLSILQHVTKVDIKNPKTYLVSQIPLLGLFEVNILNGVVSGTLGNNTDTNSNIITKQVEQNNGNFINDKPVTGINIDMNKPAVLIYHTHATESFNPTAVFNYEMSGDHRTIDRNYSVCRIGDEIKNYIEKYYGLAVEHDTTLHDYPDYTGSYNRSKLTAEKMLKKYPDAKFILDVHRDAFADSGAARDMMVAQIRGEQAAKIMIVIGKSNPHWQENYAIALKLNQKLEELYPGISRGIVVKANSIYNQDISNKSILIEMGADCSTLEETLVTAKMVAKSIGELLKSK